MDPCGDKTNLAAFVTPCVVINLFHENIAIGQNRFCCIIFLKESWDCVLFL